MTRPISTRTAILALALTVLVVLAGGLYGVHTQEGSFTWEVSE